MACVQQQQNNVRERIQHYFVIKSTVFQIEYKVAQLWDLSIPTKPNTSKAKVSAGKVDVQSVFPANGLRFSPTGKAGTIEGT